MYLCPMLGLSGYDLFLCSHCYWTIHIYVTVEANTVKGCGQKPETFASSYAANRI